MKVPKRSLTLACEELCLLRHWSTFGIYSHSKTCQIIHSFFSSPCSLCVPLSLPVDGDVKYLNTLCCLGTMHSSRWAGAVRGRCMQISIQSRPGCFQSSSSASGPVLIPLYPRPCRFFYQVKRLKRYVNLDIWPHHATRRGKNVREKHACVCDSLIVWVCERDGEGRILSSWNVWSWLLGYDEDSSQEGLDLWGCVCGWILDVWGFACWCVWHWFWAACSDAALTSFASGAKVNALLKHLICLLIL